MQWSAAQNSRRPVWPGIATARIMSSEDPGRPASEIAAQVNYSRSLARTAPGQCFWSIKSIMRNAGGIQKYLNRLYPSMAVPPAMPSVRNRHPRTTAEFYVARTAREFHRNPLMAAVRQSFAEMGRPGALRQPVGHAHPPSGQPDPRNPAQILPGGCGICRRQRRQRLWGPGPGSSSQKVEKLFPSCLYKKKNRTPRFLFFEQSNNPCPNTHAFPWRGHEQKAFYCSFLIGGAGNNQPGPGNRAIHTTTAQDD